MFVIGEYKTSKSDNPTTKTSAALLHFSHLKSLWKRAYLLTELMTPYHRDARTRSRSKLNKSAWEASSSRRGLIPFSFSVLSSTSVSPTVWTWSKIESQHQMALASHSRPKGHLVFTVPRKVSRSDKPKEEPASQTVIHPEVSSDLIIRIQRKISNPRGFRPFSLVRCSNHCWSHIFTSHSALALSFSSVMDSSNMKHSHLSMDQIQWSSLSQSRRQSSRPDLLLQPSSIVPLSDVG